MRLLAFPSAAIELPPSEMMLELVCSPGLLGSGIETISFSEFPRESLVQLDDVVERFRDLAIDARQIERQAGREIALPERAEALQEELRLQLRRGRRHSDTPSG